MHREPGTFSCAEHAIAAAYIALAHPMAPKNPTQMICEALRERFGVGCEGRPSTGITPHDWHAQAVFTVKLVERVLGDSVAVHIFRAQYSMGEEAALSARAVSVWLDSSAAADTRMRELVDLLVTNILRGQPRLRDLADRFDLPKSNIGRLASAYRVLIEAQRRASLVRVARRMGECGLTTEILP